MANGNLYHLFEEGFAQQGARVAIRPADGQSPMTYAEMSAAVSRYANALGVLGVEPGDRVTVQVEKSVSGVLALPRRDEGRSHLPAAQHRLYRSRGGLLRRRCRAQADRLRSGTAAEAPRHRRRTQGLRGGQSRRQGRGIAGRAGGPDGRAPRYRGTISRGSGRAALHLRHHRTVEGCHDHPWQPRGERRDPGEAVADQRRRRPSACAAGVSCPRTLCGPQHLLPRRSGDHLVRPLRCRRDDRRHAAGNPHDGGADLLHAAARHARPLPRGHAQHAAFHLGFRAPAHRDASRLQRPHGPRHPRALRHDRNRHDHLQSL